MFTNKMIRTVKGVATGLALTTATVFQAGGCSIDAASLNSITSLMESALENSDVSAGFSSSPRTSSGYTPSNNWGSSSWDSDFSSFGSCDCGGW